MMVARLVGEEVDVLQRDGSSLIRLGSRMKGRDGRTSRPTRGPSTALACAALALRMTNSILFDEADHGESYRRRFRFGRASARHRGAVVYLLFELCKDSLPRPILVEYSRSTRKTCPWT